MGWYAAVGRPAFFALPPETAHRSAGRLLGLPLPWGRIGGRAAEVTGLELTLAGIPLRNPVGLAAGFDKTCRNLGPLGELGFGYVVGGTITRRPRAGNPTPRIVRHPSRLSMVNAMGLPNPGAEGAASNLSRQPQTVAPRFVSLADEDLGDALSALDLLAPLADGIELNASCPNVSWGRDRDNEKHLLTLLKSFLERTPKPVFVKLPPFASDTERDVVLALAGICQEAGAAGLTCSNTRPVKDRGIAVGAGGLSGKGLWPATPNIVSAVAEATGGEIPLNACGGIFSAQDAKTCLQAGATTVQIYTGLVYEGPGVVGRMVRGLATEVGAGESMLPSG